MIENCCFSWLTNRQVDQMETWKNVKLKKGHMKKLQNESLTEQHVDKLFKTAPWRIDKWETGKLIELQIDKMQS